MITEWKARIIDDWHLGQHRLVIYRHRLDGIIEIVTGTGPNSALVIETFDSAMVTPEVGIRFVDEGMLTAIAAALKPGPTEREVAQLRETLDIERARVDRQLDAHLPRPA